MTFRRIKNLVASICALLLARAKVQHEAFQPLLTLLYRLSRSEPSRFVLKGATLFVLRRGSPHRATCDLDLLGFGLGGFVLPLAPKDSGIERSTWSDRSWSPREGT